MINAFSKVKTRVQLIAEIENVADDIVDEHTKWPGGSNRLRLLVKKLKKLSIELAAIVDG